VSTDVTVLQFRWTAVPRGEDEWKLQWLKCTVHKCGMTVSP